MLVQYVPVSVLTVLVFFLLYIQADPTIITEIRGDIQEECGKFGTVKKILLFDVRMCDGK
jgi:hypothetical protein